MIGKTQGRRLAATVWVVGCLAVSGLWAQPRVGPTAPEDVPPPPVSPVIDSPRATLKTFIQAMSRASAGDEAALITAEACLESPLANRVDLSGTAKQLYDVIGRLGGIHLTDVPDAAAIAEQSKREGFAVRRFVVFPRAEHAWVWEKLGDAPVGQIVLVADDGGQWRFDDRTVRGADRLHESLLKLPPRGEPGTVIGGDAGEQVFTLLGPTFDRTAWWAWAGLLGTIFLGLLAGRLSQTGLKAMADRFDASRQEARAAAVRAMPGPIGLATLTFGIVAGLRLIHMEPVLTDFTHRVIAFLFLIAIGWVLYNLVEVIEVVLRRIVPHADSRLDDMILPLVRKSLRTFLVVIFTLVVAQNVFGLNITGWLAGLGIAGLAVSLAAQDSVKNLFGSITVLMDKPFVVGDRIVFDGIDGTVEEIGFRSTRIRTLTGHVVTVPNMRFTDNKVENVNLRESLRRVLDVTITYDTPPQKIEQALAIIKAILAEPEFVAPFDMDNSPPRVYFNDYNAASLNIRVMYWYTLADDRDWWSYNAYSERFNLRLFRAFEEAGIEFAFPTQTLYLAGDPKRRLAVQADASAGR